MSTHQPIEPPPGSAWPACTLAEATARLTAPGARYEMETVAIRGVPTRTWKHAPRSLAALALLDTELLVPGHGDLWRGPIREATERAAALAR